MRAHVRVTLAEWDIEVEACADVCNTLGQGWCDDADVVELQHVTLVYFCLETVAARAPSMMSTAPNHRAGGGTSLKKA